MAFGWLKPLQRISSINLILLCKGAIATRKDENLKSISWTKSRREDVKRTLVYLTDISKL